MSLPISGFTAVPNPQMLSYMMSQSWIMMYAAGGAWQFGKRKVGAMSNEEFNKLTPQEFLDNHMGFLKAAIPSVQKSIQDMTPLIHTLMTQFGTFINEAIKAIPPTVGNIFAGGPGATGGSMPGTDYLIGIINWMASGLTLQEAEARMGSGVPSAGLTHEELGHPGHQHTTTSSGGGGGSTIGQTHAEMGHPGHQHTTTIIPVTGADAPIIGNKKKAGQSQILERDRLIALILTISRTWKEFTDKYPHPNSDQAALIRALAEQLADAQQSLVNLLDRYDFS